MLIVVIVCLVLAILFFTLALLLSLVFVKTQGLKACVGRILGNTAGLTISILSLFFVQAVFMSV